LRLGIQLVVIAVLALVGYLVWQARADLPIIGPYFAESSAGQRFGGGAVLVDVAPVTSERLVDTIQAIGTTRANEAVTITSKVAASRPNEIVTTVWSSRNVNNGAIPERRFPFSRT